VLQLANRVAVVTGAGRNIGRALALALAAEGAAVVVADLDGAAAGSVAREIDAAGGAALGVTVDIGDYATIEAMRKAAEEKFGRVDILVNNAARFNDLARVPFEQIDMDEWRSVMDVNITGAFACVRAFSPGMRARKWGRIVNVSSGTVRMGRPDFLHYVTSKSALIGMSRSLARELGPDGVTVNTLLPGVVLTEDQRHRLSPQYQTAILAGQCIPESLTPDAMTGAVIFMSSEASRFMTGQELAVDGGLTHG
jgi:3-oxoacyl-[acyl-carrier protein] reductase